MRRTGLFATPAARRELWRAMQEARAAGTSVFAVLDSPTEPQGGTFSPGRVRGEVEFRDVSFEYATENGAVLRAVNLTVPAGSTLAKLRAVLWLGRTANRTTSSV